MRLCWLWELLSVKGIMGFVGVGSWLVGRGWIEVAPFVGDGIKRENRGSSPTFLFFSIAFWVTDGMW